MGTGGVPQNPLARLVDVTARRQVHDRVSTPEGGPSQLVDFLGDRRGDGGVSDVGVDLHEEVPADDHRLELRMVDVGGNDRPPARHLRPHELRRKTLADGDELHFRRNLAAPRVVKLRDRPARFRAKRPSSGFDTGDVVAPADPRQPRRRQSGVHTEAARSARVVHGKDVLAVSERDLSHRDAHALWTIHVDLSRTWKGLVEVSVGEWLVRRLGHVVYPWPA